MWVVNDPNVKSGFTALKESPQLFSVLPYLVHFDFYNLLMEYNYIYIVL